MRTPAETRALHPVAPGTAYSMYFCDGIKVCGDLDRTTIVADSDEEAVTRAREAMRDRPAYEVGVLDRPVKRGMSVWVACIGESGTRMETDSIDAAWDLHRELHGCGTGASAAAR